MKNSLLTAFLATALLILLPSCRKESAAPSDSLEGTWELTNRQCLCGILPVPAEAVAFTAGGFTFLKNNQPTSSGSYSRTMDAPFCGGSLGPALRLQPSAGNPYTARFIINGNTLTLDYGSPCDAPVDTYERQL